MLKNATRVSIIACNRSNKGQRGTQIEHTFHSVTKNMTISDYDLEVLMMESESDN